MVIIDMILPSGVAILDRLFDGGLQTGLFTHVYGEAASGKTTLALQFMNATLRMGYRTVIINSEGTSPIERLEQVAKKSFEKLQESIRILIPKTFDEQASLIEDFEMYVQKDTKLLIVDTFTKLYRLSLEDKKTNYKVHRELNRQAGFLKGIAKENDVSVLVLNQVRGSFEKGFGFEPVAKNILDYWSDVEIKIRVGKQPGVRVFDKIRPRDIDDSIQRMLLTNDGFSVVEMTSKKE
jgi:RecA/RadA recombinase